MEYKLKIETINEIIEFIANKPLKEGITLFNKIHEEVQKQINVQKLEEKKGE